MRSNLSNKKLVGVFVVLAVVVGWVAYQFWYVPKQTAPVDDSGLIANPTTTDNFQPQMDEEKIKSAIHTVLVEKFVGVGQSDVEIINIEEKQWPDACLGVTQPETVCAQVITPGYLVKVLVVSQIYEVHTNQSLEQIVVLDQDGKITE